MASKRKISAVLAGAACKPFGDHLAVVSNTKPRSWAQVQEGFLRAMELFDAEVIAGRASEGERQNGKGDYFNDLIVAILQEASGRQLNVRRGVNGLIVKNYNLDVTYPAEGVAELLIEAKVMGTPKHPGSAEEVAEGRRGSADLPKRLREAAFKTIDLKAGFSLQQSQSGKRAQSGPSGSLTAWLRKVQPASFVLIAVRIVNASDLSKVQSDCAEMRNVMDGVGVFCFSAADLTAAIPEYSALPVDTGLQLDRVVHEIAQQLAGM